MSNTTPLNHVPEGAKARSSQVKIQAGIALVVLLAVSALVYGTSTAAFSATTDNTANSWDAGTVTLTDDDSGSALFTASNMVPGDVENNCIEVTYTGSSYDLTAIRLYATVTDTGLADDLDVVIDEVDDCTSLGSPSNVYTGTLDSMASSYATGATGFTPASGDTVRGYDITVTLGTDTLNSEQGNGADADFTWEVRSDDTTP